MGKKLKLNLDDLKVQSFVTSFDQQQGNKIKGGKTGWNCYDSQEACPGSTGTCATNCGTCVNTQCDNNTCGWATCIQATCGNCGSVYPNLCSGHYTCAQC